MLEALQAAHKDVGMISKADAITLRDCKSSSQVRGISMLRSSALSMKRSKPGFHGSSLTLQETLT